MTAQLLSIVEVSQLLDVPRYEVRRMILAGFLGELFRNRCGHWRVKRESVLMFREQALLIGSLAFSTLDAGSRCISPDACCPRV